MTAHLDISLAQPLYDRPRSEAWTAEPPKLSGGAEVQGGSPLSGRLAGLEDQVRAAAIRALARTSIEAGTGCLIWPGALNSNGVPCIAAKKATMPAVRAVWFLHYGELPDRAVQRTCGNRLCLNIDHMALQTSWHDEDRFWQRVDVNGPSHPYKPELGRCWDWTGPAHPTGYGNVRSPEGKSNYAHRTSFFLTHGRMPAQGMHVMHSCDRPSCVNPAHLREGTPQENVDERDERFYGRKKAQ